MKKEVKKKNNNFTKFYKKYKLYIYIGLVIIIIGVLNILFYKPETMFHKYMNIDNAFSVDTVETEDYSFLETYDIHNKIYKYTNKVMLGNYGGELYFVRGMNNLNIYQIKIDITSNVSGIPVVKQIKDNMNAFEKRIINEYYDKLIFMNKELLGESKYKFKLPIEESIYKDNRVFRKIFEEDGDVYHINYYMSDDKLVCEFIKFIK